MKKTIFISLLICLALLLTGCGAGDKAPESSPVANITAPAAPSAEPAVQNAAPTKDPFAREVYNGPPSALDPGAVHYQRIAPFTVPAVIQWDLSRLSATMAYAQLYTMLTEPEQFVGQSVKIRGQYSPTINDSGVTQYHGVVVYDSAACCELGIEFLPTGSQQLYPAPGSLIEMTGLFDICNDGGQKFCCLRVHDITVINALPTQQP